MIYKTRKELTDSGEINHPPYSYLSAIMNHIANDKESVRMFHSSVYYVRAALEKRTGYVLSLPYVERMMRECGW